MVTRTLQEEEEALGKVGDRDKNVLGGQAQVLNINWTTIPLTIACSRQCVRVCGVCMYVCVWGGGGGGGGVVCLREGREKAEISSVGYSSGYLNVTDWFY